MTGHADSGGRSVLIWCLAALYSSAGLLHLTIPGPFLSITPLWVLAAETVIYLTGVCEIAGAIGLLVRPFRKFAGIALAVYAICVFPANINHALQEFGQSSGAVALGWLYHVPRLLLQPALVWAPLYASSLIKWPFR